jgi:hypothetical protein
LSMSWSTEFVRFSVSHFLFTILFDSHSLIIITVLALVLSIGLREAKILPRARS